MLGYRFPSLVAIRAFEAAARLGSFASAARELGTTAASVSYHIRRLEQETGVILFVRHAQRVTLTPPGAIVAEETLRAFAGLRACFARAREEDETRIIITTLPSLGAAWLTPRLGRFRALLPALRVELDLGEATRDLTGGRFDLAIRNGSGEWPGLTARPMFPAIFLPLCAPAVKAAAGNMREPESPLLGRPDWWAIWFAASGAGDPPRPGTFGTTFAFEHLDVAAAVAGQGIAIASPIIFHDEIASGRLVPAHDCVASDGRAFWITCARSRQPSPKIARCMEWLETEAAAARQDAAPYIAAAAGLTA